jgi:squalene-hopene/tetraprenyl-beta-curcumene cyclase
VFTRIWLALCGEWDWADLPAMPIELMLVPDRAPISIYRFASWARATIVPLLVLMTDKPVRPVPASARLRELRVAAPARVVPRSASDRVFFAIDKLLRVYQRLPRHPLRVSSRRRCTR